MKRIVISGIITLILVTSAGCIALLEDSVSFSEPHIMTPYEGPEKGQIIVSDYNELFEALLYLVSERESSGQLLINFYDGPNVQADVTRACNELRDLHPVGVYAVSEITGIATRIVAYYEVDIEIEYKRTKQQLDSIVNVSTLRYLRTHILGIMSDYREEAVIRTTMPITVEDIQAIVKETYYENPRRVVMLPFITVDIFPEQGEDRIFELRFGYSGETGLLQQRSRSLVYSVIRNAELAVGDNDAEILVSLAANMIDSTGFDAGTARAISVHGAQNYAATAFGALVNGSAVGEGFALAYKALCDELGFECRIVLGLREGMVHAWNIVLLNGDYYHIDVAMGNVNGIASAFLKTDSEFDEFYSWNRDETVRCNGTLTYEDIVVPEEEDDPEDGEDGEPLDPDDPDGDNDDPGDPDEEDDDDDQ